MNNLIDFNVVYLFLFVFSVLINIRVLLMFILTLMHTPPKKLNITSTHTVIIGLSLSYIITYLINT